MTERVMFKGFCVAIGGALMAIVLAAPVLADSLDADGPALAVPVSGGQLSEIRGQIRGNRAPGVVRVRTENRDFGDTLPGGDFLSQPNFSGEIATSSARLEQVQTDVSMIAR